MTWDRDYAVAIAKLDAHDTTKGRVLGLVSEVGEVADLFSRAERLGLPIERSQLVDELSDVLWYVTRLADLSGLTLEQLADRNHRKLEERVRAKTLNYRQGREE